MLIVPYVDTIIIVSIPSKFLKTLLSLSLASYILSFTVIKKIFFIATVLQHVDHISTVSTLASKYNKTRDFPGGPVGKKPPANAGDMGSSPGPGRSHMPQSN